MDLFAAEAGSGSQSSEKENAEATSNQALQERSVNTIDSSHLQRPDRPIKYPPSIRAPVEHFVARPVLLYQIRKRLVAEFMSVTHQPLVIYGPGGIGKTELALDYVQQYRARYYSLIWIEANSKHSIRRSLMELYKVLFGLKTTVENEMIDFDASVAAVKRWLSRQARPCLVVFDNVCDIDIRPFLPDVGRAHIMITTRSRPEWDTIRPAELEIEELDEQKAIGLFSRICRFNMFDQISVSSLVHKLEYHPLSISMAASNLVHIRQPLYSIEAYLASLIDTIEDLNTPKSNLDYSDIVAVFEVSCNAVARESPEASVLLTMLSFLNPEDISSELFYPEEESQVDHPSEKISFQPLSWRSILFAQASMGMYEVDKLFSILEKHYFITWKDPSKSYLMHRMAQDVLRIKLDTVTVQKYLAATLDLLLNATQRYSGSPENKLRLVPHIMLNFNLLRNTHNGFNQMTEHILHSLSSLGLFAASVGFTQEGYAIELYILEERRITFGLDHCSVIPAENNVAVLLGNLGQFEKAELAGRSALEKSRQILGEGHEETFSALNNLASIIWERGKLEEAKNMKMSVVEEWKRVLGENHPLTLSAMSSLANMLGVLGRMHDAAALQTEVVTKRTLLFGADSPDTISAMNDLAVILDELGQFEDANTLLRTVVENTKLIYGEGHRRTKIVMRNLARLAKKQVVVPDPGGSLAPESRVDVKLIGMTRPTPADTLILILGSSGAEKLMFVKALTGDPSIGTGNTLQPYESANTSVKFWANSLSGTDSINAYRTHIDGQSVILVTLDFDDLFDTLRSDSDAFEEIATWLAETYVNRVRLAGVLYIRNLARAHFGYISVPDMEMFEKLVGSEASQDVVLVASLWRDFVPADEESLATLIQNPSIWSSMIQRGSTVERFSGSIKDARRIISSVLMKKSRAVLKIQRELIDQQLSLSQTETGEFSRKEVYVREIEKAQVKAKRALELRYYQAAEDFSQLKSEAEKVVDTEMERNPKIEPFSGMLEELRQKRDEEVSRLRDLLKDRIRYLEEFSLPPPAYLEVQTTKSYGDVNKSKGTVSHINWMKPNIVRRSLYHLQESCGDLLYGDFKETTSGSLDGLAARLREHSNHGSSREATDPHQTPATARSRHQNSQIGWNMPGSQESRLSDDPSVQSASVVSTVPAAQRRSLQLNVETGKFTIELGEVEFGSCSSDGILFEAIRARYEQVRHSTLPLWLRFRKPHSAIFTKFRLGRRPFVSLIAGTPEAPSIPSEAEVQAGNYVYVPCPIDEPPIDSRTFYHHFYSPASRHPDSFWSMRLPWKVGADLPPMIPGWGIYLQEGPDWPLFAACMCFCLLISGLVAGIYSWKTSDHSTGVTIGTWLTGVQTMGMGAFFFWQV